MNDFMQNLSSLDFVSKYKNKKIKNFYIKIIFLLCIFMFFSWFVLGLFVYIFQDLKTNTKQIVDYLKKFSVKEVIVIISFFMSSLLFGVILSLLYLLRLIFLYKFKTLYFLNIFSSIKYLKIYLVLSFKYKELSKIRKLFYNLDFNLLNKIQYISNEKYILQGSAAILVNFNYFWRKPNDLNFVSNDIKSKIESNKFMNNNYKKIFDDGIIAKYSDEIVNVDLLFPKLLTKDNFRLKKKYKCY